MIPAFDPDPGEPLRPKPLMKNPDTGFYRTIFFD
jgi:hypothetical protein